MLQISRSALYDWINLSPQNCDLKPRKNLQNGYGHKIADLVVFKKFVDENRDLTLDEMAQRLGDFGKTSVHRAMKKIGYVKKKTFGYIERDEKDRQEFQEKISKIDLNDVIFMDETGIDDTEAYQFGWVEKGDILFGMKKGAKSERLSSISALSQKKI